MSENAPSIRAADDDRDRVVEQLRDHYVAGRLTHTELDERITAALGARTLADLAHLTVDLPTPTASASRLARSATAWTMTDLHINQDTLVINLTQRGRRYFWKRGITAPVRAIQSVKVETNPEAVILGKRIVGSRTRLTIAGIYISGTGRTFAAVRTEHEAVDMQMTGGRYDRIVVHVADAKTTVAAIEAARKALRT